MTKKLNENVWSALEVRPARKKSGVSLSKRTDAFDSVS